uniref:FERM N-terminal domain-containing protein n=1 Tax=Oreochromis niloticus TaxID=8128 RepID=A0A669EXZ2_ORENI
IHCGEYSPDILGDLLSRTHNTGILLNKGKSPTTQRELSVVMPNGQSIVVRCEVKSRGRDVFDMIVAHFNLVEHFYFSLAYIDGKCFSVTTVSLTEMVVTAFCFLRCVNNCLSTAFCSTV